ncbi:type I-F CRISPR-associated protein Csy2 [Mitsuokella multacida]|uniref:CRISPR-associated protein, Csy2 family n=1 Tax=Mitsuokella multacida DSM 20544 TaxID=500635 RepID=C9KPV5_9FIRM|nr:type I-F CRISPR-associated protein Csy2 [Mitsuokella multacida]EEX68260.1 CRISPR-associated protein, Csy2 family [Mitsuokella multacida DSM 20544]
MSKIKTYLLLRQVKIHNANAFSSPLTIGFPAMTAWLGAMHALERKLRRNEALSSIRLKKLAVSCHDFNLQTYKGPGDYVNSVIITSNPLRKKGASFERPPFIEEARIHLTVSLLIEVDGLSSSNYSIFNEKTTKVLNGMKIAGGDILAFSPIDDPIKSTSTRGSRILLVDEDSEKDVRRAIRSLMPGYVLIERRQLLKQRQEKLEAQDTLQALLDLLALHYEHDDEHDTWHLQPRQEQGWLVPIVTGFKGLTPLGHVANQRDASTLHRFAEPVLTLGEFKMPHHFQDIDQMMWQYQYDENKDLYVCVNEKIELNEGED